MNYNEAMDFCQTWLSAWVGGKPAAKGLLEYYHPEAILCDPNHPEPVKGHKELLPFFESMLEIYPDWEFEIKNLYPLENGFVFIYNTDLKFGGKVFKNFRGLDVIVMKDNKIIEHQGFYDRTELALHTLGKTIDDLPTPTAD